MKDVRRVEADAARVRTAAGGCGVYAHQLVRHTKLMELDGLAPVVYSDAAKVTRGSGLWRRRSGSKVLTLCMWNHLRPVAALSPPTPLSPPPPPGGDVSGAGARGVLSEGGAVHVC